MLLSARTESNQRCAKGTPSMNTSPQAGVHRRRPPGPPYYGGRPPEKLLYPPGGPKTRSVLLLASAHWGLHGQKLKRFCAVRTPPTWAKPWQLVRPATAAPNRKAGTRRCHSEVQCQQIWMEVGPSGPRLGGEQILILPAGNNCRTEVTRFRRRGPGTSRL